MTKLLISARDESEAAIVARYSVDVIDLKNPAHGALGRVDPVSASKILLALPNHHTKSIALGELTQLSDDKLLCHGDLNWLSQFQFAKIGLAGATRIKPNWQDRWLKLQGALPKSVSLVGVVYADGNHIAAPTVDAVIELMGQLDDARRPTILVDTYLKSGLSSIDHLGWSGIGKLIDQTKSKGIELAIAGSIEIEHLQRLKSLDPAYIGFRGAVCDHGRDRLVERKLQHLLKNFLDSPEKLDILVS